MSGPFQVIKFSFVIATEEWMFGLYGLIRFIEKNVLVRQIQLYF